MVMEIVKLTYNPWKGEGGSSAPKPQGEKKTILVG